ncbi:MAG: VWA domain-containing protein [Balneolales bacterium]|nr:VWA domain-containing protein [Balneolales bacterium]
MTQQPKNNTTYFHLIVDKSGSMSGSVPVTLSTINEQLETIRRLSETTPNQKIFTGISFFDTVTEQLCLNTPTKDLKPVTENEYVIGGMTALLDAIGRTVITLEEMVQQQVANGEASVVVVVITDGYENASRLFRFDQIKSMIQRLEATGLWTFTYFGADLNDISDAQRMGFSNTSSKSIRKEELPRYSKMMSDAIDSYVTDKEINYNVRKQFLDEDGDDDTNTPRDKK